MKLVAVKKFFNMCACLLVALPALGESVHSGLYFHSHTVNIDGRTALLLNNNTPYSLDATEHFELAFDMYLRDETVKFGYIFRIISNRGENIDFIINGDLKACLVVNHQDFQLQSVPEANQWSHLEISFLKKKNLILFRFNEETIECSLDMKGLKNLLVGFGKCDMEQFLTRDVAPIILKNVRVRYNTKEYHHWVLDKHGRNVVYDELKNCQAIAQNPYWLMDNRIHWKKEAEFEASVFPQVTFDSIHNMIYVLNKNELISYSLLTHSEQRTKTRPDIEGQYYNHLLFDPVSNRLLFYHMEANCLSFYDAAEQVWMNYRQEEESNHAHHNRYISKNDTCLYLFGGYGFYKYKSDFFKINMNTGERVQFDLSELVTPRYLAAAGGRDKKIFILGGRGAEMGRQELSPQNFSDLYEIDLETMQVKYLFDIDKEGSGENIYSNSLVVDGEGRNLYVLAYPNKNYASSFYLEKIDLESQTTERLADSVGFYFQDITSFCDLYYSPKLSQLIAVAAYLDEQASSHIHIYTLDYPPLKEADVIQKTIDGTHPIRWIATMIAVVLLSAVSVVFAGKSKKRKQNRWPAPAEDSRTDTETPKKRNYYDTFRKSILFLGGFQVFDKEGKNITGEFTPTLKYLLVLIILYTLKNNKGISSSRLQEFLWYDKTEEAARNNRSVNMRKLRVLLEALGNIDITSQNGYWTISLSDDVLSDYREVLRLAGEIQNSTIIRKEDLMRFLELLDYGSLLPNIQLEWVDNFKTDFSNLVIDTLMQVVNNTQNVFYDHPDIRLKIADALLRIDSINEEAVTIKCQALVRMGKKGLAKTTFDNFNKEYKLLLGENFSGSIKIFLE